MKKVEQDKGGKKPFTAQTKLPVCLNVYDDHDWCVLETEAQGWLPLVQDRTESNNHQACGQTTLNINLSFVSIYMKRFLSSCNVKSIVQDNCKEMSNWSDRGIKSFNI